MNAVAAVFGAAPAHARAAVGAMLARMPARAAGQTVVVDEPPASIAAAGRAPAHADVEGVAVLAGDIRLANRSEMRAALGMADGAGDAALALEAYARRGLDFARALVGDFAIVIFDRRERRLVAARDPLGIRPLYYRRDAGVLRVASELRALVEPGDAPDEGYLAEALAGDVVDTEGTPYAAVRRVPAAHLLIATAGGVRLARYWEPDPPGIDVRHRSAAAHQQRLRDVFDEAVRACCEGDDRIGVHLSGGLDSSSVLGSVMANRVAVPMTGGNLLPWPEADERAWILAAAERWSLTPILVEPAVDPAAHDLRGIAAHRDLPDMPTGAPLFAPLHAALRNAGAGVVLTGFGGDQWWSGESAHAADLLRRGDVAGLLAWKRAGPSMGDVQWSWPAFVRDGVLPLLPSAVRRAARRARPARPPAWIDRRFAARVGLTDRLRRRPDTRGAPSESWRRLRWRLDSGEEALAKERFDRMSVAHGVELRHPMYDRRLVELALATPDEARIAGGRNRVVLREAMGDRLAAATRARTDKADLSALLIAAARADDLRPHLALPMLSSLGWIDRDPALAIVRAAREAGDHDAAAPFWYLAGVEAWLREVFGAE